MRKKDFNTALEILDSIQKLNKEVKEKEEALKYFREQHISDLITMADVPMQYALSKDDIIELLHLRITRFKERKESLETEFEIL
jgi:hypothetical protein